MADFDEQIAWHKERLAEAREDLRDFRSGVRQFRDGVDITDLLMKRLDRDIQVHEAYIAAFESHNAAER